MNKPRLLTSDACMAEGCAYLANVEPRFAFALDLCGPPPLRRRAGGFDDLLGAIVSQQVSVASARAIKTRLEVAGYTHPDAIIAATDEDLRGQGLSRQKARYIRALAEAHIDFAALPRLSDSDIIATLTAVPGIGRWTAEVYVMFSLGRADVFAANDLALQESARLLFDLPDRPREAPMRKMSEAWSPWRTVAAGLLWHYYHHAKSREGIV
ncbi:DNA-3-methyladenine glycosylase 2 family protein [Pararhodobacter sp.]|uniref:DNA-3-methyladenine glycosylase family protein n=1 Tax=Pararhodobacter sp. TaxID=2127056 RepID=UPI002AFE0010|nr:DNA-3-methyladenine glycosylase 2 family protein [Pararhodobacter sp.]